VLYVAIFNRVDDGEEHGTTSELSNPNEGWDRCSMPVGDEVNAVAVTINKAHAMCGHMGHVEARAVCKYYGQELTKKGFQQCVHCGKAKARQLAVTQDNEEHVKAGAEGHRIFLDISSVKNVDEALLADAGG
jgi:hypothetical protein